VAKVVYGTRLNASTKPGKGRKGPAVTEKRVYDADGNLQTVRAMDARSENFGGDLRYIFERNVAKARRDNKRVTGAADVAPAKS
jgi:hypothetical protein